MLSVRLVPLGVGFPIARIVTVISGATGAVLDLAIGPYSGKETDETALLRQILAAFNEGDVALGDCHYASFFLIAQLMQRSVFMHHGIAIFFKKHD